MKMKVEAVRFSKLSLNFYQTTKRIIPGDGSFQLSLLREIVVARWMSVGYNKTSYDVMYFSNLSIMHSPN
jgi:hypothetical protein